MLLFSLHLSRKKKKKKKKKKEISPKVYSTKGTIGVIRNSITSFSLRTYDSTARTRLTPWCAFMGVNVTIELTQFHSQSCLGIPSHHIQKLKLNKNSFLTLISVRKEGRQVTCKQETRTWLFSHACMHDVCSHQESKRGNENKNMTCSWSRSIKKRRLVGSPRLYGHLVKSSEIIIVTCVRCVRNKPGKIDWAWIDSR